MGATNVGAQNINLPAVCDLNTDIGLTHNWKQAFVASCTSQRGEAVRYVDELVDAAKSADKMCSELKKANTYAQDAGQSLYQALTTSTQVASTQQATHQLKEAREEVADCVDNVNLSVEKHLIMASQIANKHGLASLCANVTATSGNWADAINKVTNIDQARQMFFNDCKGFANDATTSITAAGTAAAAAQPPTTCTADGVCTTLPLPPPPPTTCTVEGVCTLTPPPPPPSCATTGGCMTPPECPANSTWNGTACMATLSSGTSNSMSSPQGINGVGGCYGSGCAAQP